MAFRIGECLLPIRLKEKGIKPVEFAKAMECSRQYVSGLIKGTETMSLEFAINAAVVLECEITDLYKLDRVSSRREK